MSFHHLVAMVRRWPALPGRWVLGSMLALAALLATQGNWMAFPLTAPIRGPALGGNGCALLILSALALWRFSRGAALLLLCAALAWLLSVPLSTAQRRPDLLQRYVVETGDRLQLNRFLVEQHVLNLSPEPSLVPIDRISGAPDQVRVASLALARPWYVTVLAVSGLLLLLLARRPPERARFWGLAAVSVSSALLLPPWLALDRSERRFAEAQRALVAGDGGTALTQLQEALALSPGRAAALPFWHQVELSAALAHAGHDDNGPWIAAMSLLLEPMPPDGTTAYTETLARLTAIGPDRAPDDDRAGPDDWAQWRRAARAAVRQELHLHLAWRLQAQGDLTGALRAVHEAWAAPTRTSQVLMADILMRHGGWGAAVEVLRRFDAAVVHPTVRADVACSVGDALTGAGRLLEARQAYLSCQTLDELTNYRVLRALGGT